MVYHANEHSLMDNSSTQSPATYESIDENIYRFEKKRTKSKKEVRRMLCDCTISRDELDRGIPGCTEDCLNRLLMIECSSRCPTASACSNKKFQKKEWLKTEPFKTEKKGWGLRTLEDAKAGTFVLEYVGEVLNQQEFKQRVKQYAKGKCDHFYYMALKADEIIDASFKGNVSRFINHSCSPNCQTEKWTVNGELRIGFFTKHDVTCGEELTFDYKFERYGRQAQKCFCESVNCTGYIGEAAAETFSRERSGRRKVKVIEREDKKRGLFEDLMLDEELDRLCSNGGLSSEEEALVLARLMVRAEEVSSRLRLLDVILKTTDLTYLRRFLNYHGLSLIWSWMADVDDLTLKTRILEVLSYLPVPNRNMLVDSKVIYVVQKWSEFGCSPHKKENGDADKKTEVLDENAQGLQSKEDSPPESEECSDKLLSEEKDNVGTMASNLLQSWATLKEIFRIPRILEPQKRRVELDAGDQSVLNDVSEKTTLNFDESTPKFMKIPVCVTEDGGRFSKKGHFLASTRISKEERRQLFAMEMDQRKLSDEKETLQFCGSQRFFVCENACASISPTVGTNDIMIPIDNASFRKTLLPTPKMNMSHIPFPPPALPGAQPPQNLPFLAPSQFSQPPPQLQLPPPQLSQLPPPLQLLQMPPPQMPPPSTMLPLPQNILSCPAPDVIRAGIQPALSPSASVTNIPVSLILHSSPAASTSSASDTSGLVLNNDVLAAAVSYLTSQNPFFGPNINSTIEYLQQLLAPKPIGELPPNWKTATDFEGSIYYYHGITRQTQWDPPDFDTKLVSTKGDEQVITFKRRTTTAAADTSCTIEVKKKIKELFRTKMSTFVVQCLNVYRKPDCKIGRIKSTEEFKYLARKLTHVVMAKELRHCKNIEYLECNESVKSKAKDFIVKYMGKFGPFYRKEKVLLI